MRDPGFLQVEDATRDPRFHDNPGVLGEPHVRHYAGAALVMPGGERIGTLCVFGDRPGRLDDAQCRFLQDLAQGVVEVLLLRESEFRRRHEQELGELESFAEFSPVGMFGASRAGLVVCANPRWRRILEIDDPDEGLGDAWLARIHPQDRSALAMAWRRTIDGGEPLDKIVRIDSTAVPQRWARVQLQRAGSALSALDFVGALSDVTEKKRLEGQLVQRNLLLESVLENLPEGLLVLDEELRLLVANRRLQRFWDLPDELMAQGTRFEHIVQDGAARGALGPGDSRERVQAIVSELTASGNATREQVRPDGTVLQIRSTAMANGWRVRTYSDVSAERRMQRQLCENEERLAMALDATQLRLWEYEPHEERLQLFFSAREMDASRPTYLRESRPAALEQMFVDPAALAEFRRSVAALLAGELDHFAIEHEVQRPHGRDWLQTEARLGAPDGQGRPVLVGTSKDITARKQTEARLRAAMEAAQQASKAKAEFLATISHEIRTPINGIVGLGRMLADSELPAPQAQWVGLVNSCSRNLLGLVDDVLDFSKIEAGRMVLDKTDTDLHRLLREMVDVFAVGARDKGLAFRSFVSAQVPERVRVDGQRLRQVLGNLLGNAVKFTAGGHVSLAVGLGRLDGRDSLRFEVADSGIGIAAADMPKLFNRFWQADASATREYRGTGLGLAIANELAALMGGRITVDSTPGVGSTFALEIPCDPCERLPVAAPELVRACAATAQLPILLVEDDAVNQMVASALLAKLGYENVVLAEDGRQAVELGRKQAFALVLMDCRMPVLDGISATRELRGGGFRAPIVALTAGAGVQDRLECLQAGMDDYLAKPIQVEALAATVKRWVGAAASRAAA